MRIVFIIHSLTGGGAERVTVNMAEYWSSKNHEVSILTLSSGVRNRFQPSESIGLVALGLDSVSLNRFSAIKANFVRIAAIRSQVRSIQPDIVISMMTQVNVMVGLACLGLPVKTVASERTYPGAYREGRQWEFLRKHTYRLVDSIVVQSPEAKYWMLEKTSAKNTAVVPNSVNLPLFNYPPFVSPTILKGRKFILSAGRLHTVKQFDHIIESFAHLAQRNPQWDLVIIGEGSELTKLKSLCLKLKIDERVWFPGRVGNIADWYVAAEIFALTSRSEGFPNVLLEAMAHGLAVVSYDCPVGPRQIIRSNENGVLIELNNIQQLTEQIQHLLHNDCFRTALGREALEVSAKLSASRVMERWERVVQNTLEHKACF